MKHYGPCIPFSTLKCLGFFLNRSEGFAMERTKQRSRCSR